MAADQLMGLLRGISGPQEFADLGEAAKQDPSLLEPPPMTSRERLGRSLNSMTRFFGTVFHDESMLNEADKRDQAYQADRNSQVITKLLPKLGEFQARRLKQDQLAKDQARKEALEAKREGRRTRIAATMVKENPDGTTTGLAPQEIDQVADAWGTSDETGKWPELPFKVKSESPEEKQARANAQAEKMLMKREAFQAEQTGRQIGAAEDRQTKALKAQADIADKRDKDRDTKEERRGSRWTLNDVQSTLENEIKRAGVPGAPASREEADRIIRSWVMSHPNVEVDEKALEFLRPYFPRRK